MNKLLLYLALSLVTAGASLSRSYLNPSRSTAEIPSVVEGQSVLGERDVAPPPLVFSVNVPAIFSRDISAPNVVYSLVPGEGISVSSGQTPTITNTGVLSLQGETGELELEAGSGISLDGLKITNTGILALSAGSGISVSGSTITNSDLGSSQSIFKTVSVAGQSDVAADSNSDTLTLVAGSGLTITTSASGDSITITPNDPSVAAGWTHTSGLVALTTSSDSVSIGGGLNVNSSGITNAGSITGATGFTSSGTITLADLSTGIVHSNIYGVLSSSAVALGSSDVTGTLGATNGGTGLSSYTTGDLIYASATNVLNKLGAGGEGEVLTMSGGIPDWGTINTSTPCPTCLVNNPGSDQTITPTAGTGLIVKKASSGSSDIFKVTSSDGATAYLKVDSSGNVLLGNGQTTQGVFTVSPTGTHPLTISPATASSTAYTGTVTSADLTATRTWTFPDATGVVCTTSGNCSGSSSALGGSGTTNYLSKWSDTYSLANSLLYDTGTNVGIGTTSPGYKLDVLGTASVSGNLSAGTNLTVVGSAAVGSTLNVTGAVDLASTLGVTGATTLSSTLGVTGTATFNGNVGIGTSSPRSKLHVEDSYIGLGDLEGATGVPGTLDRNTVRGAMRFFGIQYADQYLEIAPAASTVQSINAGYGLDLSLGKAAHPGSNFTVSMYNSEKLRVDYYGNVGIGNTAPVAKLHVTGAVTGKALAIFDETGNQALLTASASGVTKFTVGNDGTITTTLGTGTVYSNAGVLTNSDPSDLNLKQNILSLGDGTLGKVLGLRAVSYEWKRDGKGALGFIAQEVQEIFPELVGSNADGTLGLYTTQFIPVLAKAIQEQQLEIDEIKLSSASASISNAEWAGIRDLVAMLQTKVDQIFTTLNNYQDQFVTKQSIQEELCVGTESDKTCLTKQQLDDLLRVASPSATITPIPTPTPSSSPNLEPSPSASPSSTPN